MAMNHDGGSDSSDGQLDFLCVMMDHNAHVVMSSHAFNACSEKIKSEASIAAVTIHHKWCWRFQVGRLDFKPAFERM
jgi:hypothetical protein